MKIQVSVLERNRAVRKAVFEFDDDEFDIVSRQDEVTDFLVETLHELEVEDVISVN